MANIRTTAAQSPWSNGLVEPYNGVLGNTVRKIMSDKPNYSLETSVAWAIAAKNSLKKVYEFSPNQLNFEKKKTSLMLSLTNYQPWKMSHVVN